ncbi:MAG: DUF423 domain-containing protein [Candidatus Paceibacterota bacterium]
MNNQINHSRVCFGIGLLYLGIAIILGAFGAHGLKDILDDYGKDIFFKANFYHFVVAFTILLFSNANLGSLKLSVRLLLLASFIFSGSLYLLAITGLKWLGAVTPIGGTLMIGVILYQGWKAIREK